MVTHSPTIAVELATHPSVEVIIVGGRLFKHSVVAAGAAAHEAIGRISADVFFLGVTGIHPTAGPHHRRRRRGRDQAGLVAAVGRDLRARQRREDRRRVRRSRWSRWPP